MIVKRVFQIIPLFAALAVAAAAQAPAPPAIYGVGMQAFADGLENLRIPVDEPYQDNRFIAETTSGISTVRLWMKAGSGYSGGSGGTIKVAIETDDGTANHYPSGTVLASATGSPGNTSTVGFLFTLSSNPTLTAGTIYHAVISNVDSSSSSNYISTDNMANSDSTAQPYYSLTAWTANVSNDGTSWSPKHDTCPIMSLTFTNGYQQGIGYVDSPSGSQLTTLTGSTQAGETFTVSGGNKVTTAVSFHLVKSGSPSAPLTVTLQQGSNTVVSGTIPASAFSTSGEQWGTFTFGSNITLVSGTSYTLSISCSSCSSGSAYQVHPIEKGNSYGYLDASVFPDGNYELNGSASSKYDAQFYFTTLGGATPPPSAQSPSAPTGLTAVVQ